MLLKNRTVFMLLAIAQAILLAVSIVHAEIDAYAEGQRALREQNWQKAAEQFANARKQDGIAVDATYYWQAYALYKLGRDRQAERVIGRLQREFPASGWLDDAAALRLENDTGSGDALNDHLLDDELRLYALNSLVDSHPERALPLLHRLMQTTDSDEVRREALFVIGMSDSAEAQAFLLSAARDGSDPALQREAIEVLAVGGSDDAVKVLSELYREIPVGEIRESVIDALTVADAVDELAAIAAVEQNAELQSMVVEALGVTGASEVLMALYPKAASNAVKSGILEALGIADHVDGLVGILKQERDQELRAAAIEGIAISGADVAGDLLRQLYRSDASVEEKEAIIEAMMIQDDGDSLTELLKREPDPDIQNKIVEALGVVGASAVLGDLYAEAGNDDVKNSILEALAIADDIEGLARILQQEQNPKLREAAIESIAIIGSGEARELLRGMYRPSAPGEEKEAIIEAMVIQDDAEGLISLLRRESDRELKRKIIQALSVIDTEEAQEYLFRAMESGVMENGAMEDTQ